MIDLTVYSPTSTLRFSPSQSTMVKILSIFITTLAALSPVAQAGACKEGIVNCGSTLQKFRNEPPSNEQTKC
ncbi:hypothetical protein E4U13_001256 [Claviceps humidiphila]|uniref:Uncharacterized protein n=1 Tax=Claviceps humidiphila TaxID=1294629 RepID=A0A9P7Q2L5_9HYPO|nr:hypothetical protein E4U13_001256 [Claviceps humidiphila]